MTGETFETCADDDEDRPSRAECDADEAALAADPKWQAWLAKHSHASDITDPWTQ